MLVSIESAIGEIGHYEKINLGIVWDESYLKIIFFKLMTRLALKLFHFTKKQYLSGP